MKKVVFIGAGSFSFTRKLVKDLLTFPLCEDATIVLVDIDKERLSYITKAVNRIVAEGKYPARVEATQDRKKALSGAQAVVCTILAGGLEVWRHDIEIPKEYGVDINIGDTRGPSGIFRALRTIPVMLDICKDMERYCPDAILLNYTNPMAMLCRAMQRKSPIRVTGLCHSVQGTASMLCSWLGADEKDVSYLCAGINHLAWFISFTWKGKDAIPLLKKAVLKKDIYEQEIVRNEMFLNLGYYVTESSGHNSEYNWWFRKKPELIEKYCLQGKGWNPGIYGYNLIEYARQEKEWRKDIESWLNNPEPLDLNRGYEYAAYIINAFLGGEPYRFNGNTANRGLITNLPEDICVEVPMYADTHGFNPIPVGALPPQCAALDAVNAASEEMAVEGCLSGDPAAVFHAIAYDPLTSAVLSLREIKDMVNEMLKKNEPYLPTFKRFKV